MSDEISSVFTPQVMGDYRPEVSGSHNLPNYTTDIFPLTLYWGQDLLLFQAHRISKGKECVNLERCDGVGGGRGGSRGRGNTYNYGWFMLLYGRNQDNIVK